MSSISFGQLNCSIKLVEKHSILEIQLNEGFQVEKAAFQIDSSQNFIRIDKIRGNQLRISSSDYADYSLKIKKRKLKNDTLVVHLTPNDSVCNVRFEEIWVRKERNQDTIDIQSPQEIQGYFLSILNYLLMNEGNCGNGLCNHSNTYVYFLEFKMESGIYRFSSLDKQQPLDYTCQYIDENLSNLSKVLPTFRIKSEAESPNIKTRFRVWMTYY